MKERLAKVLQLKELTAGEFADYLGVQRSSISHVLSGRNKPSIDFISKFTKAYPDLNIKWFITGEGDIFDAVNISEPNLFDQPQDMSTMIEQSQKKRNERRIDRMIVFYDDGSYDELFPKK